MTTATITRPSVDGDELQLVTFYVGDLLLGLEIDSVQEINRHLDCRWVPHAPPFVRGVVNLRGDVTTLVDLRTVLGMSPGQVTRTTRNLVVKSGGEMIGLMVDRLADILAVPRDAIEAPPANVSGVEGRFFRGVYTTEQDVIVLVKTEELLAVN